MTDTGPSGPIRILLVDDDAALRHKFARFLGAQGYLVSEAASGPSAIAQVRELRPALMLLDIGMPGMPGTDVIPEAMDADPDLGIMMLSGVQDAATVTACLQKGALDYLTKPVGLEALAAAIRAGLRRRDTLAQERALSGWVKREVRQRTQELDRALRREREVAVGALDALVSALEAKSEFLSGHSARVAEYAASIGGELGQPDDEIERLRVAGHLHDIGMIGIREAVLDKRGPLTAEEYAHVQEHPVIGSRILASLTHLGDINAYVRGHHERWDGTGYPDRLAGEGIPLGARILHAAEVYDALTTVRPYQSPLLPDAAVARMQELAGAALDPTVLAALSASVGRRRTLSFVAVDADVASPEVPPPVPDAELTETRRARDAAEAASRAKSAFLATITHEMRTPMNGVLGMAEILLGTPLTVEQQEAVELIRASAGGLLSLINDVLDFSQIEAGRLDLEDEEFDLGAVARSVAALLTPRAAERGVKLSCRVERELPPLVRGDPGRVRQVISNLVGNAVKFTHQGEISVHVTADARGQAISVRDTGVGIPADRLESVFQEFHQIDGSRGRRYGGSGLGLAISRRLVEAMGGRLEAFSTVGVGSEFRVHLTLRVAAAGSPEPDATGILRAARVLLASDAAGEDAGWTRRLQAAGARVDATTGAAAALERLKEAVAAGDPYGAALIDLQFGGWSGFALAETIRTDLGLADLPIVLLMPAGLRGDAQRCAQLGIDAYLTKPTSPDDVLGAVSQAVMRRTAAGPGGPLITHHSLQARRPALRVLLAEDVVVNQRVASQMLAQRGHHVDVVGDGRAAVDAVQNSPPYDVVLMDVAMPGMDGIEATRAIRRDPRSATLPIVAVTAHALESDRQACLEAGMNGFVAKPYRPAELFAAVERFSPAASPDSGPVDIVGLRAMLAEEGMEALTDELVATFRGEAPGRYTRLQEAVRSGEPARVADAAHALKSSSAAIRAGRLAASLRALEERAREGRGNLEDVMGQVSREFEQAMTFLRDLTPPMGSM